MDRKILVLYYTQSGQLKNIIDNVLEPVIEKGIKVSFEKIQPVNDYPFPWGNKFFDCFPESVKLIPCKLKPFTFNKDENFDLVILAYQSWYLSPSIPFNSFLETEEAKEFLKGKKVITIHGVRNMWISSQEIVKRKLKEIGSSLIGNIVLADRHDNYIAGFTIIKWLISGEKGPFRILPQAGVSDDDIKNSGIFGEIICKALHENSFNNLQKNLVKAGAVNVKFNLWLMERNARKIFNKLADFALKKGGPENQERAGRIALFKAYLLFMFFIISPLVSTIFIISGIIFYPVAIKKINYFKGVEIC